MVNGSGRKLVQTRRRAAAPLIFYIRADPACSTYAATEHRRHLYCPPR
jgi:hypothetical protein